VAGEGVLEGVPVEVVGLGKLRATRAAYRAKQDEPANDTDADDDATTVVLSVWQYLELRRVWIDEGQVASRVPQHRGKDGVHMSPWETETAASNNSRALVFRARPGCACTNLFVAAHAWRAANAVE
jgi:hypothetical protein